MASKATKADSLWAVGFLAAFVLNLLSLSGVADSVVQWRCFLYLNNIAAAYGALKHLLFAYLPFSVPEFLKDYIVVTGSFSAMLNFYGRVSERKSLSEILSDSEGVRSPWFGLVLFVLPWIVLFWFGVRQISVERHLTRMGPLVQDDPLSRGEFEAQKKKERQKTRLLLQTLIAYPLVCVAVLFLFSDFAYKLFGITEIGGLPFRSGCGV